MDDDKIFSTESEIDYLTDKIYDYKDELSYLRNDIRILLKEIIEIMEKELPYLIANISISEENLSIRNKIFRFIEKLDKSEENVCVL